MGMLVKIIVIKIVLVCILWYKKDQRLFKNNIKIRLNSKDDGFIEELTKPQYRLRKDVLFWEDITSNYKKIP